MAIKTGLFVSWKASGGTARGKVTAVITDGVVPNIPVTITGTKDAPAARIQIYRPSGDGWLSQETFVGHKVDSLTEIEPLKAPSKEVKASSAEALICATQIQVAIAACLVEVNS